VLLPLLMLLQLEEVVLLLLLVPCVFGCLAQAQYLPFLHRQQQQQQQQQQHSTSSHRVSDHVDEPTSRAWHPCVVRTKVS
jgi:hypothetical protein